MLSSISSTTSASFNNTNDPTLDPNATQNPDDPNDPTHPGNANDPANPNQQARPVNTASQVAALRKLEQTIAKKLKQAEATAKTVKVTQTGSPIRRERDQRATLIGLGLNKMNRTRELQDTPEVRGMIRKVAHMVTVTE